MSKSTGNQSGSNNKSSQGNKSSSGVGTQQTKTRNADRGNSNIAPDKKGLGPANTQKKGS